ncbi:hypothetical protein GCM10009541_25430 [Micromonospora gifhornensis]|uniref:Uncharacterized protein n=1 Tax=Micromonospora gifhornensis TaxID=84594 RepID=A0ABQ4IHT9_9ACTN|nr:hypothetical protein Vgi01_41210 [Micromonospora gifhornensis]
MISASFMTPHYGWRISEEGRGPRQSPEVSVDLVAPKRGQPAGGRQQAGAGPARPACGPP